MAEISLREYTEEIEDVIAQGRYTEAVAHGKNILKQYPKHVGTYQLLGKAMLESGQIDYATDMFNRVLSANPEDMIAWIGMSEIHTKRQDVDAAIASLERAFELEANNEALEEELRRLYSQREGTEISRVPLTRGALAHLYLKGGLLSRAINELRELWKEQPERIDLAVALAEALWHNDQRLEASEVCQKILDQIPYCIKANLILGEIWDSSGRKEGWAYLEKAQALDPENRIAHEIFGEESPLMLREVTVTPLETVQVPEEEPEWMTAVEPTLTEEEPAAEEEQLFDIASALETQIELPSWLEEVSLEEEEQEEIPIEAPTEDIQFEEEGEEEVEVVPDWLSGLSEEAFEEIEEPPTTPEAAEWFEEGAQEEAPTQVSPEPVATETLMEETTITEEEGPEWMAGLGEESLEALEETEEREEVADWTAGLEAEAAEAGPEPTPAIEAQAKPAQEIPDWLAAEELPSLEDISQPDWLQEEEIPTENEAMAWLEQIAAETEGDEQAQAAAEAHLADIMDRPAEDIEEIEAKSPAGFKAPAEPITEAAEPAALPDWMQDLRPPSEEPTEPAEAIEEVHLFEEQAPAQATPTTEMETEEAEEAALPDWMAGEEIPSGDEALAWLEQLAAGKEEELQTQAQVEAEARLAEIMGRPAATEPTAEAEEKAIEEPAPAPEAPPEPALEVEEAAEIPDWMQELRPEEPTEPVEAVEEIDLFEEKAQATPAKEMETEEAEEAALPDWMAGEEIPSGDEALAWLEQLAAGKEEELQTQAQVEAEARLAEIMGRPAATEPTAEAEEEIVEEPTSAPEAPPEPALEVEEPAEIPDWMQELRPEEPTEPVEAVEEIDLFEEKAQATPAEEMETEEAEDAALPDWMAGEEIPSGEEALAWLEQLSAGKEEELQAQAQAEADTRLAEIMGRPTPTEPTAEAEEEIVEKPAPAPEVPPEPALEAEEPAEIPDWMQDLRPPTEEPTPEIETEEIEMETEEVEEAFGWVAFDEPETITAIEEEEIPPVAETEAEQAEEMALPDWMAGEGIPSGDEALAWLEQLAAGKEEELQAQAQAEAEARLADIMGRPKPEEPAIEEKVEEIEEEPAAEAELAWEAAPPPELPPEPTMEPEEAAEEAAEEVAEIPDWMQKLRPAEPAEIPEEPTPQIETEEIGMETEEVEEAFGWVAFGEPEALAAVEEEIPPPETIEEISEPAIKAQPADMREEPEPAEPVIAEAEKRAELPEAPIVEEEVSEAPPEPEEITPPPAPPAPEDIAIVAEEAVEVPPSSAIEAEPEEIPAEEMAEVAEAATLEDLEDQRVYLKENPRDYDAWLNFARVLWQSEQYKKSLEAYSKLISSSKHLEEVIPDMQDHLAQKPESRVQRVLGDAYMKDGQLEKALELYRNALETLQ